MTQKLDSFVPVGRSRRMLASARLRNVLAGTAFVFLPVAGCASDAAPADETEPAAATPVVDPAALQARQMELMTELQTVDQALTPMRERALEDPEIKVHEQALVARVDAAMEGISPGVVEARTRFDAMVGEYTAAQQAGDQEKVQALGTELQGLQMRIQQTQAAAVAQEDIAAAITSFRETLFEWMRAEDPEAGPLLDRADEITGELESMGPPGAN